MTNREHILKVIAGLDDAVLYDVFRSACELCPRRNKDACYEDITECDKHIAAWMNMEVEPK